MSRKRGLAAGAATLVFGMVIGSWECRWTTFLEGAQITVEGPLYDTEDTVLAVTGGTGAYASAQSSMEIHALGDGKYDFIFDLT
jgi:hypothetical protein